MRMLSLTTAPPRPSTCWSEALPFISGPFVTPPQCQALGAGDTEAEQVTAGSTQLVSAAQREGSGRCALEEEEQSSWVKGVWCVG